MPWCGSTTGADDRRRRSPPTDLDAGRLSRRAAAAAAFVEALTRDPSAVSADDVEDARAAGVEDDALAEAIYVAFVFNTINRVADALGFEHRSDRGRRRGAEALRRLGYQLPAFLLR
jgi:alkylhydroperoxidase family enzyme